jgi:hypothetical protein
MPQQTWSGQLNPASPQASGAGAALSTAATATLSPVTGSTADVAQIQPAAQQLGWYVGLNIEITARGSITTTGTSTTATFLLASRVGNAGSTYITLATHAQVLNTGTTAITGIPWVMHGLIRCTAIATSGNTVSAQAEMTISANPATAQTIGTATAGVNLYLPSASGEQVAAVDTTQLQGLSLRATLAGANATIQLSQWLAEAVD